jgi:hypothetical protein
MVVYRWFFLAWSICDGEGGSPEKKEFISFMAKYWADGVLEKV